MSTHISEELPGLLTGEADRDTVLAAAEHLRTCADCRQELVSAVVAHASLTSAQRFAPEIVGRPAADAAAAAPGQRRTATELPDLSAVFAQVRKEAAEEYPPVTKAPRRRPYLLAAAAAVVVAAGTGVAVYAATSDHGSHPSGTRTIALAAFDTGHAPATATIGSDSVSVDATALPHLAGKRYEVWLTDSRRTRMQPIGWIGNDGRAQMSVPPEMMSEFSDIEVSVQRLDSKSYDYSNTSVLRGAIG